MILIAIRFIKVNSQLFVLKPERYDTLSRLNDVTLYSVSLSYLNG